MNQDTSPQNKLCLLMIYGLVYPDKFEGDKATKLIQLARLSDEDMTVVNNMRLLVGTSLAKKTSSGGFSLKFDNKKTKQAARKDRVGEEETWQLFRFYPMLEIIENLNKGELPKTEYSCLNGPSSPGPVETVVQEASKRSARLTNAAVPPEKKFTPHSMRSRRTATWAKPHHSDDGYSSDSVLKNVTLDLKKMGQRIFVFIIGGAT